MRIKGWGWGWAVLVIALVVAVYFHEVVRNPAMVITSPCSVYHSFLYPRTAFVVESLFEEGSLPLWRPSETCGIPTLGNPQVGVFYPPNVIVLLFGALSSIGLRFIISLFLAGIFTWLYCREIGLGHIAALFSSLAFMLSGFIGGNVFVGHIQHISTIAWLPICLYFAERIVRRVRMADAVGLSVCLACQFLAGHPQYFAFSFLATSVYFLCAWFPGRSWREMALYVSAALFFCVLSAIQLLPMIEFSSLMTRGDGGYGFASGMSLHPVSLLTFIQPAVLGDLASGGYWGPGLYWEHCGYLGVTALVCAVTGAFFSRAKRSRIFLLLAVFSLLMALGCYLPVHRLACRLLPPLMMFRVPSRMLFIYSFAVAVLAGMGLDYFIGRRRAGRFSAVVLAAFCLIFAGGAVFHFFPGIPLAAGRALVEFKFGLDAGGAHTMPLEQWQEQVAVIYGRLAEGLTPWPTLVSLGLLGIVMLLYNKRILKPAAFGVALTVLLCAELLSFGIPLVRVTDPSLLHPRTAAIDFLAGDPGKHRLLDLSGRLKLADVEPYGIESALSSESGFIRGYADLLALIRFTIGNLAPGGSTMRRLNTDFDSYTAGITSGDTPHKLISRTTKYRVDHLEEIQNGLDIMNVKYIALNNAVEHPAFELAYTDGAVFIYRNRRVLPRAFLVDSIEAVSGRKEALLRLARSDPRDAVIVERENAFTPGTGGFRPLEPVYHGTDRITCSVETGEPAFLVVTDSWYPGWEAYIDGRQAGIFPAYGAFRGVALPPGRHEVELRYNPVSYRAGRAISAAGLVAALLILFSARRRDGLEN